MPGVMDRMELRKVSNEADEDSTDSLDENYSDPMDKKVVTLNRSAALHLSMSVPKWVDASCILGVTSILKHHVDNNHFN